MSMRVTKRCSKCSTTFKGATCTNDCPTKHLRWTVFEDRNVNGKRSRRTVGTFASSKDAEAARVEAEENTRHGRVSVSSTMTLEEWCDEWLETQGHRFAPTSMTTMMVGFRRWLIPASAASRCGSLTDRLRPPLRRDAEVDQARHGAQLLPQLALAPQRCGSQGTARAQPDGRLRSPEGREGRTGPPQPR